MKKKPEYVPFVGIPNIGPTEDQVKWTTTVSSPPVELLLNKKTHKLLKRAVYLLEEIHETLGAIHDRNREP